MTTEQISGAPFEENAQTVIKTDADYVMSNADDVVDVTAPGGVTISLPPNPRIGQRHRLLAPAGSFGVDGNGHVIAGGFTTVQIFSAVDYTFSAANVWVANCCALNNQ